MDFVTAIKTVFSKYATFTGRARRSEFWYWYLFTMIVGFVTQLFGLFGLGFMTVVVSLCLVIPNLAVSIRRLHDIGRSGWWLLVAVVPAIVTIISLVAMLGDVFVSAAMGGSYSPDELATKMSGSAGLMVVYLLSLFVSLVGAVMLIVLFAKDSQAGKNQYGENPKGL